MSMSSIFIIIFFLFISFLTKFNFVFFLFLFLLIIPTIFRSFSTLTPAMLYLPILFLFFLLRYKNKNDIYIDYDDIFFITLVTLLSLIGLLLFSKNVSYSLMRLLSLLLSYFLFVLVKNFISQKPDEIKLLLWAIILSNLANVGIGLFQFTGITKLFLQKISAVILSNKIILYRANGFWWDSNYLGMAANFAFFANIALIYLEKDRKTVRLLEILLVINFIGCFLPMSLSSVISLILASIAVFFFFKMKKLCLRNTKNIRFSYLVIFLVLVGIFLIIPTLQRLNFSLEYLNEGIGSIQSRLFLARSTIKNIIDHPIFGVGYANTGFFSAENMGKYYMNYGLYKMPHNSVLEFISDFGLLGSILLFYFLIPKNIRTKDDRTVVGILLLIPLLVNSVFLSLFDIKYFWVALGVMKSVSVRRKYG